MAARKATAEKTPAKKTPTTKPAAKKTPAGATPTTKPAAKKTATTKPPATKPSAKKTVTTKPSATKSLAKKTATTKPPATKSPAKVSAARKTTPKTPPEGAAATKNPERRYQRREDLGAPADAFFAQQPPERREHLEALRALVKKAAPGARESMKWGMPYYELKSGFCALYASPTYAGLNIMAPPDRFEESEGKLEGTGKTMRHLKVRTDADPGRGKHPALGEDCCGTPLLRKATSSGDGQVSPRRDLPTATRYRGSSGISGRRCARPHAAGATGLIAASSRAVSAVSLW